MTTGRPAREPADRHQGLKAAIRALVAAQRHDGGLAASAGSIARRRQIRRVWSLARRSFAQAPRMGWRPQARREARLAVLSTYESAELVDRLELACRALGLGVELYSAPYGQVEQEALRTDSELAALRADARPGRADDSRPRVSAVAADGAAELVARG